jgi:phosphoglycolate phosphatase
MHKHKGQPGVIFDLDGTLIDTLDDITDSLNETFEAEGRPVVPRERVRMLIGEGLSVLLHRASGEEDEERIGTLVKRYREIYRRRMLDKTRPYPGIEEVLGALTAKDVPMCVLSNKPDDFTVPICKALLGKWSFVVVRGSTTDTGRKPNPASALELALAMGRDPGDVYFVGDSAIDMETARNAGMAAVGASWGFRDRAELEAAGAVWVIDHPRQLMELFR